MVLNIYHIMYSSVVSKHKRSRHAFFKGPRKCIHTIAAWSNEKQQNV